MCIMSRRAKRLSRLSPQPRAHEGQESEANAVEESHQSSDLETASLNVSAIERRRKRRQGPSDMPPIDCPKGLRRWCSPISAAGPCARVPYPSDVSMVLISFLG